MVAVAERPGIGQDRWVAWRCPHGCPGVLTEYRVDPGGYVVLRKKCRHCKQTIVIEVDRRT